MNDSYDTPATRADTVLAELSTMISYLRIATPARPGDSRDWIECADLIADADRLARLVRSSTAARGTDEDAVAMSLFMQGYAFRIASTAIGSFVLSGDVVDVDPTSMSVALGDHRPNAVRLARPSVVAAGGDVGVLHDVLVDGHVAPFIAACRRALQVGERMLWSNAASSCAASFGAFVDARPDDREHLRDLAERFSSTARPELRDAGQLVRIGSGTRWVWERAACCLYYQTDSALGDDGERRKCGDCSLWTPAERTARYAELLAQD